LNVPRLYLEAVRHARLAEFGEPAAAKEFGERLIQVSQGAVQKVSRRLSYPIALLAKLSDLSTLRDIIQMPAGLAKKLTPKVAALFEGEIVNEPRSSGEVRKNLGLLISGIEPVFLGPKHNSFLPRNSTANKEPSHGSK